MERLSKGVTVAAVVLAIPLELYVDPAVGLALRIIAAAGFAAAFACARRWPNATMATAAAAGPVLPALLAALLHVEAQNAFYSVWLAWLLGALLPRTPLARWTLPSAWRWPLATWALTLALAWPVMIVREAGVRLGVLRDTGALDSWALLTTPQVESWILVVVITQLVAVLWLESIMLSATADTETTAAPAGVQGLWIGASVASLVAIYQATVNIAFLSGGVWPGLHRAAGTLLDANAYGTVAALAGPIAFISIPYLRVRHTRLLQAAVLALNWGGVWMSGSRTGLTCGVFGTLMLGYEFVRAARKDEVRRRNTASLLSGIAAVVLLLAVVGAGAIGPLQRFTQATGGETTLRGLWARGGYGTVATRMIRDYPWTGVGVGSFNWMAPDYWRVLMHDRLPFDNAQNWWRHQVAELGTLASLPVIAVSLMIAWLVFTRRAAAAARLESETLRGLLFGIGVASLFGMPTQNPVVLLLFFYIAARFEWLTRPRTSNAESRIPLDFARGKPNPESPLPAWAWVASVAVAVAYAGAHLALARGPLKPMTRAERTNRDYIIGTYPSERGAVGYFRWTRKHASYALNAPTRYLIVRYHIEHPDAGTHPVKVRITTPCQTVVDEFRSDASEDGRALELSAGEHRITFDTEVSRTWRPSQFGKPDSRDLGLSVETDFVGTPAVAASETHWIALKECRPI